LKILLTCEALGCSHNKKIKHILAHGLGSKDKK